MKDLSSNFNLMQVSPTAPLPPIRNNNLNISGSKRARKVTSNPAPLDDIARLLPIHNSRDNSMLLNDINSAPAIQPVSPLPIQSIPTILRSSNCHEFENLEFGIVDFVTMMISKKMGYTISKHADPTKQKSYNKYNHIHWTTKDSKDFTLQNLIRQAMSIVNHVINHHDQCEEKKLRPTLESLPPLPNNPNYRDILKAQKDAKQKVVTLFRDAIISQCGANGIVRSTQWPPDNLSKWIRIYDKLKRKDIPI